MLYNAREAKFIGEWRKKGYKKHRTGESAVKNG